MQRHLEAAAMTGVPVLLITGTCGSGKSTITAEINDALAEARIPNAALDLDALTWQWPPRGAFNSDLMFESLAALWTIFRTHGAQRLTLARVIEHPDELERYRAAVPGAQITVCRLLVPTAITIRRLRARMPAGPSRDWHERRTVELDRILAQRGIEDFTVVNEDRAPRPVAVEVLLRAGWL